jgi:ABC-type Fe3+-hydroxamate transport system substrate-binding protein
MRSILLLTLTLLLAACSDNSDNNQSTTAKTSEKETIVEQKQVAMESVTVTKTVTPVAVIEEPAVKEKEEVENFARELGFDVEIMPWDWSWTSLLRLSSGELF